MTFYNHIESVRNIAIDLTNGKKWHGASDKAAVFDALDAARREYMRLSDENAKLRDEVERLRSVVSDGADNAREVLAENAKLREAVATAIKVQAVLCGDADSPYCREECSLHRRESDDCLACDVIGVAQELGIEVN